MGKRVQQFDTAATALCILLSAGVLVLGIMSLIGHTLRYAWLMLAFGIMFQSPVAVLILVRLGLISVESLRKKRPYVMVAILVIAALLTPPDIVSQVLLAVPTWLLFELGLYAAGRMTPSDEETGDPDL